MKKISYLVFAFGDLILLGGFMGFIKAGSRTSLLVSLIFCLLFNLSGYLIFKQANKNNIDKQIAVLALPTILTIALNVLFVYRYIHTRSFMPAGLMVILSTIVGCILIVSLTKKVKQVI